LSVGYDYDTQGRLAQITYPSGKTTAYAYDANGRPAAVSVDGQPLLSAASYQPFGPVSGWTRADGSPYQRTFDLDGRLQSLLFANNPRVLQYDLASQITGYRTALNPAIDQSFTYDAAGRVTGFTDATGSKTYAYDASGNRAGMTATAPDGTAAAYPYAIDPATNRLLQAQGPGWAKAYAYDAAGNTTADGTYSFAYDAKGRLSQANGPGMAASYRYNSLGYRTAKTVNGAATRFVYDPQGKLLGEYDGAGNLVQENIYLAELPVGIVQPDPANPWQAALYAAYTDQLGAVRVVWNAAGRAVWQWKSAGPFGDGAAAGDPRSTGRTFTQNLRFPGQYRDAETGLYYNLARYYDPQTGRYTQPDPIGLDGGINPYAYVGGNPVSWVDPYGLFAILWPVAPPVGFPNPAMPEAAGDGHYDSPYVPDSRDRSGRLDRGERSDPDRSIWPPERMSGFWNCKARADCNDNIPGNCPDDPKQRFAFGGGSASDLGTARNIAKANATSNLQCQPKHVSCKCTGPKGEQYSGGC
jgi:RHS repeat-associated protein